MPTKHVHQYKRIIQKPSNRIVYRCMRPGCSHYLTEEFIRGKLSVCWGCLSEFVMDLYSMERTLPKCINCRTKVTNLTLRQREKAASANLELVHSSTTPSKESSPPSSSPNDSSPGFDNPVADILKRYGL